MVVARTTRRDGQFSDDASMLERYQILRALKSMLGLDPGIHAFKMTQSEADGWPGT